MNHYISREDGCVDDVVLVLLIDLYLDAPCKHELLHLCLLQRNLAGLLYVFLLVKCIM